MTTFEIISIVIATLSLIISGFAYYKAQTTEKESIRLPLMPIITFEYYEIYQIENYIRINLKLKNNSGEIIGIKIKDYNFICSQPTSFPTYIDKEESFCVVLTCKQPSKIRNLPFNFEIKYRDINHNNYIVEVQKKIDESLKVSLPKYTGK